MNPQPSEHWLAIIGGKLSHVHVRKTSENVKQLKEQFISVYNLTTDRFMATVPLKNFIRKVSKSERLEELTPIAFQELLPLELDRRKAG